MEPVKPYYAADSLHLQAYDAFYDPPPPSIDGDIDFYADLARRCGGPVLELGAGTGRVALALAAAGLSVVGLDLSDGMLAIAAEKRSRMPADIASRAEFRRGDMSAFELDREFGLVIVPFRGLQLVLDPQDQRRALTCMRAHLRAGGLLALHLFDPRLDLLLPDGPTPAARQEGVNRMTGRRVEAVRERTEFDHLNQIRREAWRYTEFDESGAPARQEWRELALRWSYRWEMRYLLELTGFSIEAEYGDFKGSPPAYGREQVWVARPR